MSESYQIIHHISITENNFKKAMEIYGGILDEFKLFTFPEQLPLEHSISLVDSEGNLYEEEIFPK